jgi:hypothetical protein
LNASDRACWTLCRACFRCQNKGWRLGCSSCSGRHDPEGRIDPYHIDDRCRCTEGFLQYRLPNGRFIVRRFQRDPFGGRVIAAQETEDERDWQRYLGERREALDDPTFDPVRAYGG